MKKIIRLLQSLLREDNQYSDLVDGLAGKNTMAGIQQKFPDINDSWSKRRKIIAAIQLYAELKGIDCKPVDGYLGPVTQVAIDRLQEIIKGNVAEVFRPEDIVDINPNQWPKQYSDEFYDFYGTMGDETNLTSVDLPYKHYLSWDTSKSISRLKCHKKVASSVVRVLEQVLDTYGIDEIKRQKLDNWGGCFNVRSIRGGRKPSMHSWGIAMDYYPSKNQLRWGSDRAVFARSEYNKWWEIWESEGWVSLGRARNFDWMHVQAAKI
ncbi:MAG: M15 family peptidase [Bacteroidota bacterium]